MITYMAAAVLASMSVVQQVDTTFAVPAGSRLDLYNHQGSVTIDTWNRDEIRIRAEWDEGRRPVTIRSNGSSIRVRVEPRDAGMPEVDFEITAPRSMSVAMQGVTLAARVDGLEGNVAVQSVEGPIEVTGGKGNVSLQAVDGSVEVRNADGKISVHAVEGPVTITDSRGALNVESVDGDVTLTGIDSDNVSVNVVDGDVSYAGTIRDDGRYFISTHDGDLSVRLPKGVNARVSVATFDGDLVSDIPIQLEGDFSQKRFSFTLGSGRALMELSSFDGVIRLTEE
ncbi:MAG: DUF4097 family beta strand repeat-containing protein [Gemmatimonadales bacterium]|jgi:hypothetical protein